MPRQSGGAYRGRVERDHLPQPIAPIQGERHVFRTLHGPNRNYRSGTLFVGRDGKTGFAISLSGLDALVAITLPVVRFGRDPATIFPTIEVRL